MEKKELKGFVLDSEPWVNNNLRKEILLVAEGYKEELIRNKEKKEVIHIDEIASGIAKFYEKIRKIIDWKDDNLLRRGAIERVLKRKFLPSMIAGSFKTNDSKQIAQTIVEELIRSGHLPNHQLPQERVDAVSLILKKYLFLLNKVISNQDIKNLKKGNSLTTHLIEIAACEIEESLTRPVKEYRMIEAMANILSERIVTKPKNGLEYEEILDLMRVSVQRTLYHLDDNYIIYMYLVRKYPNWQNPSKDDLEFFSENIEDIKEKSEEYINSKLSKRFDNFTRQVSTVFLLLDDIFEELKKDPNSIESNIKDKEIVVSMLKEKYSQRYKTLKRRLRRSAFFSTLSVFLSNWVTFYFIEVPIARLFYEEFNLLATIIDFLLPALVMFVLIIFIKPPKEDNLERVLSMAQNLLYEGGEYETYEIKTETEDLKLGRVFIEAAYILGTIFLLVGIGYIFYLAQLPMTSVIYDTFTIALTFYAAVVVRKESNELYVGDNSNFRDFLFDVFTVPIAKVGAFLSNKWKEYNVVAIFTNYLVEIPFVTILDFIETWSEYIKEQKSELR